MLTHGFSRVVIDLLLHAVKQGKRFRVLVTEARPDCIGLQTAQRLKEANVPVTLVVDAAVGYVMETVDLVLVGAEGIVENGGIINKVTPVLSKTFKLSQIGTYQISVIASAHNKPFYAAAESFKFMRLFPLNQRDLKTLKIDSKVSLLSSNNLTSTQEVEEGGATHDYTPPAYITLLFTELGVLTPAAVSDELIKLYY